LSLTPMLCSRFLRPSKEAHHGRIYAATERFFDGMLRTYDWTLKRTLKHRFATFMVSIAVVLGTGYLFYLIPKGFLPDEDTGQIFGFTEGAQDVSFASMVSHQQALNRVAY